MGYYIDLKNISIDQYRDILKKADLLPGRMALKENIDNNFLLIRNKKINHVGELQQALKNKKKLQDFAKQSGLPGAYLTLLIREVNSIHPKPNNIKDFPDTQDKVLSALEKKGIKNTLQLYDYIQTSLARHELANSSGIEEKEILRLTKLTDLSRIRWVNHTFAYVLLEAGYDAAEKVARAGYEVLYEAVKQLNEERNIFKGRIGLHDMKLCVEAAQNVPLEIQY